VDILSTRVCSTDYSKVMVPSIPDARWPGTLQ
jgi:hypothetical protein